ncbi:MAG: transcription antitermination factor NusB [Eubacteriales bacterium]|nr:transcription antitermination factor NusB [Eubacteriales bacterium]
MSRREIREHIFKLLFLLEFYTGDELNEQAEFYMDEVEKAAPAAEEKQYIAEKFRRIESELPEIDQKLTEVSSGWKLKRMNKVDLAILRLAAYEAMKDEEIPTGVAINEAVELAKKFGGDDSPSFVNGVLAKLVKE